MVNDILLLTLSPPLTSYKRMVDPMLLKALLINQMLDTPPPLRVFSIVTLSLKKFIFQCCLEVKRSNW
jgi:hypothetical protein